MRNKYIFHELQLNSEQEVFSFYMVIIILYTVLPRNKLINTAVRSRFVRFADAVRTVCGRGSYRAICGCGSYNLRLRFVQFAVAVRTICGCGSYNLRLRFVQFAVAVRTICGCGPAVCGRGSCNLRLRFVRFFHRPQKTMASCSDVSRLQRLSYTF